VNGGVAYVYLDDGSVAALRPSANASVGGGSAAIRAPQLGAEATPNLDPILDRATPAAGSSRIPEPTMPRQPAAPSAIPPAGSTSSPPTPTLPERPSPVDGSAP
jgi:hypothetical protein